MLLKSMPAGTLCKRKRFGFLLAILLAFLTNSSLCARAQTRASMRGAITPLYDAIGAGGADEPALEPIDRFHGLTIERIDFEGVDPQRFNPLPDRLAEVVGTPLTQEKLARSLRAVYSSGLFDTVEVAAKREGEGVALIFSGAPRT